MRSLSVLPVLSTLALLLNYSLHTATTPLALEANVLEGNKLEKRCANPCGYNDWLCCESGQTCTTNSAQEAVCANSGSDSGGGYQYYTTTYVLTNTDPTTTEAFTAPVGTDGADLIGVQAKSSGGLSGGAIAGIVIGSIVGAFLLLLLCACICFKGVLEGLLAALGIGKKRRRQDTTYIEERHSHHSHGSRPPPPPADRRTWFGTRPAAGGSEVSEKKDSKWGLGTIAIILGALALCLGLKRKREREHDDDKTESSYPSSYYYYSDYYSGTGSMFTPIYPNK